MTRTSRLEMETIAFKRRRNGKILALSLALLVALLIVAVWRLTYGEMPIPASQVLDLLFSGAGDSSAEGIVVRSVRLPRLLAALGVGAALAVAGIALQAILQNPLAEPYTLGIASGAGFGGSLAFFASATGILAVVPAAFAGALAALGAVWLLARSAGGGRVQIVLAGIIVSSFLSAGVTFLKAVSGDRLSAIVMWLMGGFSGATLTAAATVWLFALLSFAVSWLYGRQLDAIALGEHTGSMLGVDERRLRIVLLCTVSLAAAAAVSFFGIIGFVGLVVPHLMRMLIGSLHRPLLCCSFLAGALLMASADGLAQICFELPVGVITALIGAPCFCWIMVRRKMTGS